MVAAFAVGAERGWHACHPGGARESVHVQDLVRIEALSCVDGVRATGEAGVVGLPNSVANAVVD